MSSGSKNTKIFIILSLLFMVGLSGFAKPPKKKKKPKPNSLQATKVNKKPRIDGVLNEEVWQSDTHFFEGNFIQRRPNNGARSSQRTKIKLVYDDYAIYVAAKLYDTEPQKILKELGPRDGVGKNADMFGIALDTYHNRQNAFFFVVTAAGVQIDIFTTPQNDDFNWNAVWRSAVKITDEGWVVEMEIPYSALRFPKKEVQNWGLNFYREVRRTREESFWNRIDPAVSGFVNQFGVLKGLKDIKPPTRLSVLPYVSGSVTQDDTDGMSYSYGGGMDLKYGINESFTLDMSLIPDFSQVQSDNLVNNLGPFEVFFQENRPFFTEGTELFGKGNLFYSRRVGQSKGILRENVSDEDSTAFMPSETQLINATKISGRTKSGLGIGIFNAVTKASYARVYNKESGETREVLVDPLTNYSVLVIDQNLRNNSNITFLNTNVSRSGGFEHANVNGLDFRLNNKSNTYRIVGFAALSQQYARNTQTGNYIPDLGYKYRLGFAKTSGNFQYFISRNVESNNYNPNDMGFLRSPNEVTHEIEMGYNTFKPKGVINQFRWWSGGWHQMLHKPNTFAEAGMWTNANITFTNFWTLNLNGEASPVDNFDYFSPRALEQERYLRKRPWARFRVNVGTDDRKKFRVTANAGVWTRPAWNQIDNWVNVSPRYRVNNRLSFTHNIRIIKRRNERGYANTTNDAYTFANDNIVYGRRNVNETVNTFILDYAFNHLMNFRLRVRHYWSDVQYDKLYNLEQNGDLSDNLPNEFEDITTETRSNNVNFNAFNIDFVYNWQFAPGSFITFVWKNAILNNITGVAEEYAFADNFRKNVMQVPQRNTFSLKVIYFLDYLYLKKWFKK